MSAPAVAFAAPADVELAPNPINPAWIIEGNPQARAKRLAESADGASSVMAWSCTPGRERKDPSPGSGRHGFLPGRQPQRSGR
jgi:uncharacterized cupin superfamily protein